MSTTVNSEQGDDDPDVAEPENPLVRGLLYVRSSFTAFVALIGIILVVLGASPLVNGVFAGMFGVWGFTALACAAIGFAAMMVLKTLDE